MLSPKFAGKLIKSLAPEEPPIDEVGLLRDPEAPADLARLALPDPHLRFTQCYRESAAPSPTTMNGAQFAG